MHARFVLQWLAGELDALPLWNGGPSDPHITDGAGYSRSRNEIEEAYDWAHLARTRFPWPGESTLAAAWRGFGWAFGAMQLLGWVCGELPEGPTSGLRISGGPPTLYEVSLDSRRAMTALLHARQDNQPTLAGRMEAIMETFLWLAGWSPIAPIDRNGDIAFDDLLTTTAPNAIAALLSHDCPAKCIARFANGRREAGDESGLEPDQLCHEVERPGLA